ncbi:Caspase domain protein [Anatilimnocola aggregata]|uniref:Caspase domain protein n=1 Tax=Anatilimnocola aggregata TaxID=2528021 RepID=A0A517YGU9_9BACT|nr:caspase family protein [Anatilimnocola aggregata]QDU29439.1 Caspase domain protein [Anatilimnocola aggregata]
MSALIASHRLVILSVIALNSLLVFAVDSRISAAEAGEGKSWAVLIGAERYHRATHLKYTINDVRILSSTLRARGGYDEKQLLLMTDDESNARFLPLRTNLMKELPAFFDQIAPGDSVLVYFSGHGFKDREGKLYIAALDCDPSDPVKTGVPVAWLREQVANCRANFKLVVLDACHAGSEKGEDTAEASVAGKDIGDVFRNLEGVVTIASSTADEKSQIWDEKEQSLFSYWLNQGFKGHADENADAIVDMDELYKYVSRNVVATSKARFPRPQTPVRIVRSGTPDVPAVIRLKPRTLRQVLADNADVLATQVDKRQMAKIGVLEFTDNVGGIELLGASFGALGKWCTNEFEQRLMEAGADRFEIIDQRRLQNVLKTESFAIDDIGSAERMERLSSQVDGMSVVAIGTLTARQGRRVVIQTSLMGIDFRKLGTASGVAELNESEWAMLGRSVAFKPEDRRIDYTSKRTSTKPVSVIDTAISRAEQRSRVSHPLRDPQFPFPISIKVRRADRPQDPSQVREFIFKSVGEGDEQREECFLPVRKGEVLEVWIGNRSKDRTIMRCLVDGLNTLPEKDGDKGVTTWITGKRVNLDEARAWLLDPKDTKAAKVQGVPTFVLRGFASQVGTDGKMREFTVVDADRSLAARQKFTDQIGIITAAFYVDGNGPRGVGIDAVREISQDLRTVEAKIGNLISVVSIRYADADTLHGGK